VRPWFTGLHMDTPPCETQMRVGGDLRKGASSRRRSTNQGSGNQPHTDRDILFPHVEASGGREGAERESRIDTGPKRAGSTPRNTVEIVDDKVRNVRSQMEAESL